MQTKGLRFPKAIHYLTGENVETDDSFGRENPGKSTRIGRSVGRRGAGRVTCKWSD